MAVVSSLAIGRFKQLPQRSQEVWQGGLMKMPMWVDNPDDPAAPFRPTGVLWRSLRSGRVHLDLVQGDTSGPAVALDALIEFAKKESKLGGGRPARVEVRDAALRDTLTAGLAGTDTAVVVVPRLPAVDEALRSLEASQGDGERVPGFLEIKGVTVDRLRAFADAAVAFHRGQVWRHLLNEDMIVVEAPLAPKGMSHLSVMGNGGQQFGVAFFPSRAAFDKLMTGDIRRAHRAFGLTLDPPDGVPIADLDAWEEHALPLAAANAYPFFAEVSASGGVRRPSARALTFTEGVLRALAATTEDELDSGRWQREVATFDGPVNVVLSLPDVLDETVLDPMDAARSFGGPLLAERVNARVSRLLSQQEFGSLDEVNAALTAARTSGLLDADAPADAGLSRGLTPLEQAQEVVDRAHEAAGRRRISLAKKALALSPDCADAWSILAASAATPEEAEALYGRAVVAGRQAIGDRFEETTGQFWSHVETRPYMRARAALAHTLADLERFDDAVEHYRALLQLNPNDNQGVRYPLLALLLECRRDDDARGLIALYEDDAAAEWAYGRALLSFRLSGDTSDARRLLQDALVVNPHVARFLIDPEDAPWNESAYVTLGGPDEAVGIADAFAPAFDDTPGAMEWLAREAGAHRRAPGGRGGRGRHTRGPRR